MAKYHKYKDKEGGYYRHKSKDGHYYTTHPGDSSYSSSRSSYNYSKRNEGCYIATYVYESYDSPQVLFLRFFRDNYLQKSYFGRLFIKFYYFLSPKLINIFRDQKWFHRTCKYLLEKLITSLRLHGCKDYYSERINNV